MAAPGVSDRGDVFGFVCINREQCRALVSGVFQIIVIDPFFPARLPDPACRASRHYIEEQHSFHS